MVLNKIIFDPSTGYSFGIYRHKGGISLLSTIHWLSTKHTKDELKKIYPNTSIILLDSPSFGDFEKENIKSLIINTQWVENDLYKIGIFDAYKFNQNEVKHYIFDWKADNCFLNIEYFKLSRRDMSSRCLPLTIDVWREIRLGQIL